MVPEESASCQAGPALGDPEQPGDIPRYKLGVETPGSLKMEQETEDAPCFPMRFIIHI